MTEKRAIDKLTIKGFKSLQDVELELGQLNVLIGPNGAGKSNFVSFFHMLREMAGDRFQLWTAKRGGASRILTFGASETPQMTSRITIGESFYEFTLENTDDYRFVFVRDVMRIVDVDPRLLHTTSGGHLESICLPQASKNDDHSVRNFYSTISNVRTYHFHDTSETAGIRRKGELQDNAYLRSDASNLAAYLHQLMHRSFEIYEQIIKVVRLAIPFFDDFVLAPQEIRPDEYLIQLTWKQVGSDYPFLPSQLSDGSLRFICLVTALLQPVPPSTIIIDEPEIGLHPYAITLLGALIHAASERMQIIVATQSVSLVNQFGIENLIVVEREDGVSVFKRLDESDFDHWLEDYSVGELWEKNVLGGRLS